MNRDEIRAHLEWLKANPYAVEPGGNFNSIEAIESLLAREMDMHVVRAILNPERKT